MYIAIFLALVILPATMEASQFGNYLYTEYKPGTLNLIITSSHGGSLKPGSIPDRGVGCWDGSKCIWTHGCSNKDQEKCQAKILKDTYTQEIALLLAERLGNLTGKQPHVVLNHLHRVKLDTNREKDEATFDVVDAKAAYDEFHWFIGQAKSSISQVGDGNGLLLDIHGQSHPEEMTELGYMVIKDRLNGVDGKVPVAQYSSIRSLANRVNIDFESLLRGDNSLGHYLQDNGHNTVPSPVNPKPGSAQYFTGGHIIKTHGSRYGGEIDAIQVEIPKPMRNSNEAEEYASHLASAVFKFMREHYGL